MANDEHPDTPRTPKSDTLAEPSAGKLPTAGKKRSRNGCLNCRRKRRKCSETKPTCEGCQSRGEKCEWGIKVSFRPENAQTVGSEHRSLLPTAGSFGRSFQIVDVTAEVARDYLTEAVSPEPPFEAPESFEGTIQETVLEISPVQLTPVEPNVQPATPLLFKMPTNTSNHSLCGDLGGDFFTFNGDSTFLSPNMSDSTFEDGIFLPGSQYQELHAELRSRLIDTARSTAPSRAASRMQSRRGSEEITAEALQLLAAGPAIEFADIDEESRRLAQLSPAQEFILWQNYIKEVAPWLDKFDIYR